MSLIGSSGKSGSFFFYSANYKYMIKSISKHEFITLRRILKNLYNHYQQNKETLLCKLFGLHKLKTYKNNKKTSTIIICVMNNVFEGQCNLDMIFDLKGSKYKREKGQKESKDAPFKDLDFLRRDIKISLEKKYLNKITNQLEKDSDFLSKCRINDYSVLIGIKFSFNLESDENKFKSMNFFETFSNEKNDLNKRPVAYLCHNTVIKKLKKNQGKKGEEIELYIGIIDILTGFGFKKNLEYRFKRAICGKDISCIPPKNYSERFLEFMKKFVFD